MSAGAFIENAWRDKVCILLKDIFAASSEKVPSNMRKMRWYRSSCACTRYHSGHCSLLIQSVVSNDSVSRQGRPGSDRADAQADLGLRCPHMPRHILWGSISRYRSAYETAQFSNSLNAFHLIYSNFARNNHCLTLVLLNPDMSYLYIQRRSRSVGWRS